MSVDRLCKCKQRLTDCPVQIGKPTEIQELLCYPDAGDQL